VIVWSGMSRVPGGTADLTALTNEKRPARRADLTAGGCVILPYRCAPASFIQGGSAAAGRWRTRKEKPPIELPACELAIIAWVRNRFMDTPLLSAAYQIVVGGLLVFGTGILIGSS